MNVMKFCMIVKIVVILFVVLLCIGFVMFFFFRLLVVEGCKDFNFYMFVLGLVIVVFEMDDFVGMI